MQKGQHGLGTFKGPPALNDDIEPYEINYQRVPTDDMRIIYRYVETGKPVGIFLFNVLINDLYGAVKSGTSTQNRNLLAYVSFIQAEIHEQCWGTHAKHDQWRRLGGLKGIAKVKEAKDYQTEHPDPEPTPPPLSAA